MTEGLITVVVPVYNVEAHLDRCLQSIVGQTYRNIEIILVEDGSSDRSPEICEEWAKKDGRVRVIHQAHAGAGMARNAGIAHAGGEYLCFVDSDDYAASDAIAHAYALAKKEGAEIVVYGFTRIENGRAVSQKIPRSAAPVYRGERVRSAFLPDLLAETAHSETKNLQMSPCTALYSMELIRRVGWRFVSEEEIISEDVYSLLALYRYVERVAVLSEALYFYCLNPTSLTKSYRKDRFRKIKEFYIRAEALCDALGYSSDIKERLKAPFWAFTIDAMKQEAACCPMAEAIANLQKIVEDPLTQRLAAEGAGDGQGLMRRVLFGAIRRKSAKLCWLFAKLRNSV